MAGPLSGSARKADLAQGAVTSRFFRQSAMAPNQLAKKQ
jgi:hypothetical protein